MARKIQVSIVFLLAICLFSLVTTQLTEAAPTPAEVLAELDAKLDELEGKALAKKNKLSAKVTDKITKFNNGDINREKFCRKIKKLSKKGDKARFKWDKKITKASVKKIKKLENVGGTPADRAAAEAMETASHLVKDGYYDTYEGEITAAKNVPASPCIF